MVDKNIKLTEHGIMDLDKKFDESLEKVEEKEAFLKTLEEYVWSDEEEKYENLASYQRWYAFLVWPSLVKFSTDKGIKIIKNFFHVAFLFGYDVWNDLLQYVMSKGFTLIEQVELYEKIVKSLKDSKVIIAKIGNKNYVFSDILEICKDKIKNENDTEGLKILLKPVIFCPDIELLDKYYVFDREKILDNYIKLIKNILTVKEEQILKEIDKEFHPEFADSLKTVEEYRILVQEKTNPLIKKIEPKIEKKPENNLPKIETKPMTQNPPSYIQIKEKILQFFPKDEIGEIIDTEGVFEVLEKTANKYNDEKIKELYYFDEATGKFEWSV